MGAGGQIANFGVSWLDTGGSARPFFVLGLLLSSHVSRIFNPTAPTYARTIQTIINPCRAEEPPAARGLTDVIAGRLRDEFANRNPTKDQE